MGCGPGSFAIPRPSQGVDADRWQFVGRRLWYERFGTLVLDMDGLPNREQCTRRGKRAVQVLVVVLAAWAATVAKV